MDLQTHHDAPLVTSKPPKDEATFDITAMIDLVFMMNIFFMVTTLGAGATDLELPTARHCVAADTDNAVIVTVTAGGLDGTTPTVYIGDGKKGGPISDFQEQEKQIQAAVQAGLQTGKTLVLIKAEQELRYRDISRFAKAATTFEEVKLHMAVTERD